MKIVKVHNVPSHVLASVRIMKNNTLIEKSMSHWQYLFWWIVGQYQHSMNQSIYLKPSILVCINHQF